MDESSPCGGGGPAMLRVSALSSGRDRQWRCRSGNLLRRRRRLANIHQLRLVEKDFQRRSSLVWRQKLLGERQCRRGWAAIGHWMSKNDSGGKDRHPLVVIIIIIIIIIIVVVVVIINVESINSGDT